MREPRKFSIGSLLHGNLKYVIPEYQRGYDWKGDTQVRDLFVDLTGCLESSFTDNLFLGSMIFDVSKEKSESILEVIDGQQRLTTLLILLMSARDYARDTLQNEAVAQSIQAYISNSNALSEVSHHRLQPSSTIADLFMLMCSYEWDRKFPPAIKKGGKTLSIRRQISRVRPIYEFCRMQIATYCAGDTPKFKKFANQVVEHTFVIRIDIEDRAEAFEIFERTNARGKGLEVSDLLKNFLFSNEKHYADQQISDVWDELVERFGDNLLRALKYFWVSRKGAVTSRDLYRKLRYYAGEIGIAKLIDELRDFSKFYQAYHADDAAVTRDWLLEQGFPPNSMYLNEFRRVISVLRLFQVTQAVPFVFSLVRGYSAGNRTEKEAKRLLSALRTIESFHFVNNKVCNRIGNESEKAYAEFSETLFHAKGLAETDKIRQWFQTSLASLEEFTASLSAISYQNRTERLIIRYVFDKLVNVGVKEGQRIDLLDIEALQKGITSSFDIEHLLPQSEAEGDDAQEIVHQIGNLIVIPKQINGIMSNASFPQKMKILGAPWEYDNNIRNVPSYLQEFVAEHGTRNWDGEAIKARTAKLAQQAYEAAASKSAYT
ncbi:MAG: DUF262 domain-containing protein [Thermaurantiacus sp.]